MSKIKVFIESSIKYSGYEEIIKQEGKGFLKESNDSKTLEFFIENDKFIMDIEQNSIKVNKKNFFSFNFIEKQNSESTIYINSNLMNADVFCNFLSHSENLIYIDYRLSLNGNKIADYILKINYESI